MEKLDALLCEDGYVWLGQCITYDIASQGKTEEEARENLSKMIGSTMILDTKHEISPLLSRLDPPPKKFKEIFDSIEETVEIEREMECSEISVNYKICTKTYPKKIDFSFLYDC